MIELRRASERGHANWGWLDTYHTFSFGEYYDPAHMGFRALRVLNEDRVAPGKGFNSHPHHDMEILTYVLDGAIAHRDSTGGQSTLRAGELQRMTAGRGVRHSEFNDSDEVGVHFLQIWIEPSQSSLEPGYEQRPLDPEERRDRLAVLVSPGGAGGSLHIHQDARVLGTLLNAGTTLEECLDPKRFAWVQIATGQAEVNGHNLGPGDAVALRNEDQLTLRAIQPADILVFDLA